MKKILLTALSSALICSVASAQEDTVSSGGKMFEHHIGVQLNTLIRQVFNFNNSTTNTNTNPYLLVYSINLAKSGWGLRIGGGYNTQSFGTDDGITKTDNDLNDWQGRLGIEKSFRLSEKWRAGVGIDAVISSNNDKTTTMVRGNDTTTTVVNSTIKNIGGGAMGWVRYYITPHIALGTETSFYYMTGTQKQTISITQRDFTIFTRPMKTTTSSIDQHTKQGTISLPIAFYIIVRF